MKSKIQIVLICLATLVATMIQASPEAKAGVILDVGVQTNTFTGLTRGYWFTAPVNFYINGARVVTDASTASQDVEILRLNAIPPVFSSSTNDFTSLFRATNVASLGFVDTGSIAISAGDIIGVLGSRGANSINSYQSGPYNSDIFGNAVVLTRFGMQFDLRDAPAHDVWQEPAFPIGRIELDMSLRGGEVPEPNTLLIFAGIGFCTCLRARRRKQKNF